MIFRDLLRSTIPLLFALGHTSRIASCAENHTRTPGASKDEFDYLSSRCYGTECSVVLAAGFCAQSSVCGLAGLV